MSSFPNARALCRLLTAFFWLLIVGALSPAAARASCGDYVHVGGRFAPMMGRSHVDAAGIQGGRKAADPDGSLPPGRRCHGLACSRESFPPIVPPQTSASAEQWACVPVIDMLSPPARSNARAASCWMPGDAPVTGIFRPPR